MPSAPLCVPSLSGNALAHERGLHIILTGRQQSTFFVFPWRKFPSFFLRDAFLILYYHNNTGAGDPSPALRRWKIMKMIKAMIRPEKFEEVKTALDAAGFGAMTIFDVEGRGVQRGIKQQYRGAEYVVDLIPKRELEIVVADDVVENVIETIRKAAYTGKVGDGQIFILPVEDSIRVRTGERGSKGI